MKKVQGFELMALLAVLLLASCINPVGGDPGDDPDQPITKIISAYNVGNMNHWQEISAEVRAAKKYVILDLSACTGDAISGNAELNATAINKIIRDNYYIKGIILPAGLITIGDEAFSGCYNLTFVSIPASITTIGDRAFSDCTGLTSITLPAGLISIGGGAFSACINLTGGITIPGGVTTIGDGAFSSCRSLTGITISTGVTTIGMSAFSGCTGLTAITIPGSVTTIEYGAFSACSGLTEIQVDPSNTIYSGFDGVLFNMSKSVLIKSPAGKSGAYVIPSGVTTIKNDAFEGCTGLTAITIPSGVTTIERDAFKRCTGLRSVTIPAGVTTIERYVFSDCTGLGSVTIPDSVTTIEDYAFSYCASLTSVTISGNVSYIMDGAFSSCGSLTEIQVAPGNLNYKSIEGVLFSKDGTKLIQFPGGKSGVYTIPDGVTTMGMNAFSGCGKLTAVTIPGSVTTINVFAFSHCTSLTRVIFGQGSSITEPNFSGGAFPERVYGDTGDSLKTAYFAATPRAGTYTRAAGGDIWTKQ